MKNQMTSATIQDIIRLYIKIEIKESSPFTTLLFKMKVVNTLANVVTSGVLLGILYILYRVSFDPVLGVAMKVIGIGCGSHYIRFMNPTISFLIDLSLLWYVGFFVSTFWTPIV